MKENEDIVIFKIGSDWCNACNKIKQILKNSGLDVLEINVDDSFQLYSFLVLKKIVKKIPALICYNRGNTGYVPNLIYTGSNENEINIFFENCKSLSLGT